MGRVVDWLRSVQKEPRARVPSIEQPSQVASDTKPTEPSVNEAKRTEQKIALFLPPTETNRSKPQSYNDGFMVGVLTANDVKLT